MLVATAALGVAAVGAVGLAAKPVKRAVMRRYFAERRIAFDAAARPPLPPLEPERLPDRAGCLCRSAEELSGAPPGPPTAVPGGLRVVTLNIEMGRQLGAVIANLRALCPDIVLLQEVDLCVPRTDGVDEAGEIARELGMHYVFACEVVDPCVIAGLSAGPPGGRQGNAVLSRFPVAEHFALRLACRRRPEALRERHERYKAHCVAGAVLRTPFGDCEVYSVHLDPHHTGARGRAQQYAELMAAVRARHRPGNHCLIAGDFNTVGTTATRYTRPEAEWFDANVVQRHNAEGPPVLRDPFDKRQDTTLRALGGLLDMKLDWCLVSDALRVVAHAVGREPHQQCSDHRWVCVDVVPADAPPVE